MSCLTHQITIKYVSECALLGQCEGLANVQFMDAAGGCELHLYLCQTAGSILVLKLGCAFLWPHVFAAGIKFTQGARRSMTRHYPIECCGPRHKVTPEETRLSRMWSPWPQTNLAGGCSHLLKTGWELKSYRIKGVFSVSLELWKWQIQHLTLFRAS